MSPRGPASEYGVLLDAIQRLALELGRNEIAIVELRRRAARAEARVAELRQAASLTARSPEPAIAEAVVEPVAEPPQALEASPPDLTEPAPQPAFESTPAAAGPTFTRIVPVPAPQAEAALEPEALFAPPTDVPPVEAVAEAPVPASVAPPRASEPIWSRVPDRYRRIAWIAAPILSVMIVSTWITSADSPDAEPTVPGQGGAGIVPTATAEVRVTPFSSPDVASTAPPGSSATSVPAGLASPTALLARTPTDETTSGTPTTGTAQATSTAASPEQVTATSVSDATATVATAIATEPPAQPTPTETPTIAPTEAVVPGEIVAGGVGSSETQIVETFGESDGEDDGRSSYSEGGVLVTYGAESRAVRITFVLDLDDLTMALDEAESLAEFYRPPGAQLLSTTTVEPGLMRRVYSSATLAALFAGSDTGGRAADRYVEELRFDPQTQRALSIEMALGELP